MAKTLIVVTHIEPYVSLRPIRAELHLCADYYDGDRASEDGPMFRKEYPGVALAWGHKALKDAEEYAQNEGYSSFVLERIVSPGITERVYEETI